MKIVSFRDLTLMHIDDKKIMVVACDSCGGIGMKEEDIVKVPYEVLGYFTTSVVLCELLAIGATPIMVVDNICMEMKHAGEGIIKGIHQALEEIHLDGKKMLTGSTEENMKVIQSGLGITCLGIIDKDYWSFPKTYAGDDLFVIGSPKLGKEVSKNKGLSNLQIIDIIRNKNEIHEILPVGSKGIGFEISELCRCNTLNFQYSKENTVDIYKSAGPGTCVLVSGIGKFIVQYLEELMCEHYYLGRF
ncbi:MAG: AIR synthase related protein [Eubacteriales bacterium]